MNCNTVIIIASGDDRRGMRIWERGKYESHANGPRTCCRDERIIFVHIVICWRVVPIFACKLYRKQV